MDREEDYKRGILDQEEDQKIDTVMTEETKETEADHEDGMMIDLHEKDEMKRTKAIR